MKQNEEFVKLELGCGSIRRVPGATTIDREALDTVDIVADLNKAIPMENESVDEIYSFHFLEHVDDFDAFMKEVHRVLKPGGKMIGTVPHFSNPYFYSDPTHNSFFGLYTFSYYSANQRYFRRKVPVFYSSDLFDLEKVKLVFKSPFVERWPVKKMFGLLVNISRWTKEFYEENLCYIVPAYELYFELLKKESSK